MKYSFSRVFFLYIYLLVFSAITLLRQMNMARSIVRGLVINAGGEGFIR